MPHMILNLFHYFPMNKRYALHNAIAVIASVIAMLAIASLSFALTSIQSQGSDDYLQMLNRSADPTETRVLLKGILQVCTNNIAAAREIAVIALLIIAMQTGVIFILRTGLGKDGP